jgi:hypothetical protein
MPSEEEAQKAEADINRFIKLAGRDSSFSELAREIFRS